MSDLYHRTVRLTARKLRDLGACEEGVDGFKEFLPCKISTDPEENIDLALRLVAFEEQERDTVYTLSSLSATLDWNENDIAGWADADAHDIGKPGEDNWRLDPYRTAQVLAAYADSILVRSGK